MLRDLSLTHVVRKPGAAGEAHPPLLILLHGVGSNEHDLFGLAPHFDDRFLVVSARAPLSRGPGSYAWFSVRFLPDGFAINPDEAEESRQKLLRFTREALEHYHADPRRVFLAGFSQGCIMSLFAALTEPELFRGVAGMSGRLLPEALPKLASPDRLNKLPLLIVHGTDDTVIPVSYGRGIRDQLSTLPVRLDYREFPMGHTITEASLAAVTEWLRRELDRPLSPQRPD